MDKVFNLALMREPYNWLIIPLMLLLSAFMLHLLMSNQPAFVQS